MLEKTRLTIPNRLEYLDVVFGYIDSIVARLGYAAKDKYAIRLAAEECLNNVIKYCFEEDESQDIDILCELIPNCLRISIQNQGMPFDPSLLPEYSADTVLDHDGDSGLSAFLMKKSVDVVNFINLGKNGNEIQLIKYLPAKSIEQYGVSKEPKASEAQAEPRDTVEEIRLIHPDEEAIEVCKCIYISYGNTYVNEDVYYPERLRQFNIEGRMTSALAISERGQIAGHVATFRPADEAKITEWGMAVVKHAFRGQGIMQKLVTFIIDVTRDQGFDGIFAHCVTEHDYTQKVCHRHEFGDVALALGYSPSDVKYRNLSENLTQRQTIIFSFRYFKKREKVLLHPPVHHTAILEAIYAGLGLTLECSTCDPATPVEEKSVISTELKSERNTGNITVHTYGRDVISKLAIELKRLCLERIDVIYLNLDLSDPVTASQCEEIERLGFFLSGILPGHPFEHTLILQYLNNVKIDLDKVVARSSIAKELVEYVRPFVN